MTYSTHPRRTPPPPAFDWNAVYPLSDACEERRRQRVAALIGHSGIEVALRGAKDDDDLNRRALVALQWVGFQAMDEATRRDVVAQVVAGMAAFMFKMRRQQVAQRLVEYAP